MRLSRATQAWAAISCTSTALVIPPIPSLQSGMRRRVTSTPSASTGTGGRAETTVSSLPSIGTDSRRGTLLTKADPQSCSRCRVALRRSLYEVRAPEGTLPRCLRCSLTYGPLVRRSLVVALIVGTILTAINQGNVILRGDFRTLALLEDPAHLCCPVLRRDDRGPCLNARRVVAGG